MSTRVQKGGTVFKPVAKPRGRTEARTSVTPAPRASAEQSTQHGTTIDAHMSSTMPPPATVPLRPSAAPNDTAQSSSSSQHERSSTTSKTVSIFPSREGSRPPVVQVTPSRLPSITSLRGASNSEVTITPTPVVPSRAMSRPPAIQVTPGRGINIIPSRQVATTERSGVSNAIPSANVPLPSGSQPLSSTESALLPNHTLQIDPALLNLDAAPASDDRPRLAIREENIVKVPRTRKTSQSQAVTEEGSDNEQPLSKRNRTQNGDIPTDVSGDACKKRKRKSRQSTTEVSQTDEEASGSAKRKRGESGTPRRTGRKRAPSPPPFDVDADPGEDVDPTVVTMATLCDDNGQGRVSSKAAQIVNNHAAWRAISREKRARMKAAQEAKKYGRNEDDEPPKKSEANNEEIAGPSNDNDTSATPGPSNTSQGDEAQKDGDEFDYSAAISTSRYNVQVRIGPNGETIIDEDSLFVDRNEEQETADYTHLEESDTSKFVNSATYSRKFKGSRWSVVETELFFDALSQFGENYELISYVLPGRDRKACRNKFKAEDKRNPNRITWCLDNRKPYDIETLSRLTGKDFSGPTPEIRAPAPMHLPDGRESARSKSPDVMNRHSPTPGVKDGDVLVEEIDDDELETMEAALFGKDKYE